MKEIDELFARSASKVYSSALEVAEVVGVSLSFDRFIRAMYEYSDHADERLWAPGADGRYEKLATNLIDQVPREKFIQEGTGLASDPLGMQRQFLYRFRARRALYDCLSAKYPISCRSPAVVLSRRPMTTRPGRQENRLQTARRPLPTKVSAWSLHPRPLPSHRPLGRPRPAPLSSWSSTTLCGARPTPFSISTAAHLC